jgi:hypothetical protein
MGLKAERVYYRWSEKNGVRTRLRGTGSVKQAEQARVGDKRWIKIEDYHGKDAGVGRGISQAYRGRKCKSGFD